MDEDEDFMITTREQAFGLPTTIYYLLLVRLYQAVQRIKSLGSVLENQTYDILQSLHLPPYY